MKRECFSDVDTPATGLGEPLTKRAQFSDASSSSFPFLSLPFDVQLIVVSNLAETKNLLSLRAVCRELRQLVSSDVVWKTVYLRSLGLSPSGGGHSASSASSSFELPNIFGDSPNGLLFNLYVKSKEEQDKLSLFSILASACVLMSFRFRKCPLELYKLAHSTLQSRFSAFLPFHLSEDADATIRKLAASWKLFSCQSSAFEKRQEIMLGGTHLIVEDRCDFDLGMWKRHTTLRRDAFFGRDLDLLLDDDDTFEFDTLFPFDSFFADEDEKFLDEQWLKLPATVITSLANMFHFRPDDSVPKDVRQIFWRAKKEFTTLTNNPDQDFKLLEGVTLDESPLGKLLSALKRGNELGFSNVVTFVGTDIFFDRWMKNLNMAGVMQAELLSHVHNALEFSGHTRFNLGTGEIFNLLWSWTFGTKEERYTSSFIKVKSG